MKSNPVRGSTVIWPVGRGRVEVLHVLGVLGALGALGAPTGVGGGPCPELGSKAIISSGDNRFSFAGRVMTLGSFGVRLIVIVRRFDSSTIGSDGNKYNK